MRDRHLRGPSRLGKLQLLRRANNDGVHGQLGRKLVLLVLRGLRRIPRGSGSQRKRVPDMRRRQFFGNGGRLGLLGMPDGFLLVIRLLLVMHVVPCRHHDGFDG